MASSLVNNKYRITRRIGGGSFGEIYMGIGPNGEKVAIKFERQGTRCPQLRHEYKVYRELANCHGFCSVYHFGAQDNYNVMVMDLLGPSLEDLFNRCSRRFSLKTVLQLADQILERVDTLHSRHLIHRDIKPANFVIGTGEQASNVFCVDFGLSKRYRHPKNLQHIPHRDGRSLTGTPRYASINNHLGIEQSRRDDLESVGYVLIYFLKGTLPWQGLKAKNAQKKYRMILEKKQQVSIAQLCQGCPSQFAEFLAYTRSLKFDAKPDIPYLRKLFRDLYHAQGCASVGKLWDWDNLDMDFPSSSTSSIPPAGAPPVMSGGGAGIRPNTAVTNMGVESDVLLGGGDIGMGEESFGDGPARKDVRPNTAGPIVSTSQRPAGGQQQGWGNYQANGIAGGKGDPRTANSAGIANGAMGDDMQRRPHTAHGSRGVVGGPLGNGGSSQQLEDDEDGEGHVVAGARAMMRYRKSRGSGDPGTAPGTSGSVGRSWTGDSAGGSSAPKPTRGSAGGGGSGNGGGYGAKSSGPPGQPIASSGYSQQRRANPSSAGPPASTPQAASGWMAVNTATDNRPKSASGPTTGVLMASITGGGAGPRGPVSSTTTTPQQSQQTAAASAGSSNLTSFGSLKNRFLSGGSSKPQPTSGTAAAASKSTSSKIFGLR